MMILVIYHILLQLAQIISSKRVKKAIQNSAITTVDSSVNVSFKTLIEQQAAISSNIDKLTNTFCNQLTNLTSILTHNVNVEETSRGSSSTSSQEKSLVVKNRHKETRKSITMKFLPQKILMIQMVMIRPLIKALRSSPITVVCSQQHQHIEMMINKYTR